MGDVDGGGDADERPVHMVTLRSFRLSRHEVTRGEFRSFVSATGYRTDAERNTVFRGCLSVDLGSDEWGYSEGKDWRNPGFVQTEDHPVVCVSWNDVQAYIGWLSRETGKHFRLPTEAEWEYAARAGTQSRYPWGANADAGCGAMNAADLTPWPQADQSRWRDRVECIDGSFATSSVGHYAPNAWGLNDVVGNVWEWTSDCLRQDYVGAPGDGTAQRDGDCSRRTIRGGAWCSGPKHTRVSARNWDVTEGRGVGRGFRLVQDD